MNEWLQKNSWSILIVTTGVVGSWAVNDYRISRVEAETIQLREDIGAISSIALDVAVLTERSNQQKEDIKEMSDKIDELVDILKEE